MIWTDNDDSTLVRADTEMLVKVSMTSVVALVIKEYFVKIYIPVRLIFFFFFFFPFLSEAFNSPLIWFFPVNG